MCHANGRDAAHWHSHTGKPGVQLEQERMCDEAIVIFQDPKVFQSSQGIAGEIVQARGMTTGVRKGVRMDGDEPFEVVLAGLAHLGPHLRKRIRAGSWPSERGSCYGR